MKTVTFQEQREQMSFTRMQLNLNQITNNDEKMRNDGEMRKKDTK